MADTEPILIASDIHVWYTVRDQRGGNTAMKRLLSQIMGRKTRIHAVKGVSFVINRGEAVGLVGTNGSGKSSLVRVLAGLQRATTGAVWATSTPAMLSVSSLMMDRLSGARNVRLGLLAKGLTPHEVTEVYPDVVQFSGVADSIHFPVKTYSSGMKARLKFATAIATVPEILLVDEALGTGDANFRAQSEARMQEIISTAGAVLMVNHSANAISATCNRVIWLEKGELVADGPTDEVLERYRQYVADKRK